jgi:hypothetical protein
MCPQLLGCQNFAAVFLKFAGGACHQKPLENLCLLLLRPPKISFESPQPIFNDNPVPVLLVRSCSDGKEWGYLNAILYIFVVMTIHTIAISCKHFTHVVFFGFAYLMRNMFRSDRFSHLVWPNVWHFFSTLGKSENVIWVFFLRTPTIIKGTNSYQILPTPTKF